MIGWLVLACSATAVMSLAMMVYGATCLRYARWIRENSKSEDGFPTLGAMEKALITRYWSITRREIAEVNHSVDALARMISSVDQLIREERRGRRATVVIQGNFLSTGKPFIAGFTFEMGEKQSHVLHIRPEVPLASGALITAFGGVMTRVLVGNNVQGMSFDLCSPFVRTTDDVVVNSLITVVVEREGWLS